MAQSDLIRGLWAPFCVLFRPHFVKNQKQTLRLPRHCRAATAKLRINFDMPPHFSHFAFVKRDIATQDGGSGGKRGKTKGRLGLRHPSCQNGQVSKRAALICSSGMSRRGRFFCFQLSRTPLRRCGSGALPTHQTAHRVHPWHRGSQGWFSRWPRFPISANRRSKSFERSTDRAPRISK